MRAAFPGSLPVRTRLLEMQTTRCFGVEELQRVARADKKNLIFEGFTGRNLMCCTAAAVESEVRLINTADTLGNTDILSLRLVG